MGGSFFLSGERISELAAGRTLYALSGCMALSVFSPFTLGGGDCWNLNPQSEYGGISDSL